MNVCIGSRKRTRCGSCAQCHRQDCGKCSCIDMVKFGGPGKKKKTCILRKCINNTTTGTKEVCCDQTCLSSHSMHCVLANMAYLLPMHLLNTPILQGPLEVLALPPAPVGVLTLPPARVPALVSVEAPILPPVQA